MVKERSIVVGLIRATALRVRRITSTFMLLTPRTVEEHLRPTLAPRALRLALPSDLLATTLVLPPAGDMRTRLGAAQPSRQRRSCSRACRIFRSPRLRPR